VDVRLWPLFRLTPGYIAGLYHPIPMGVAMALLDLGEPDQIPTVYPLSKISRVLLHRRSRVSSQLGAIVADVVEFGLTRT
jgi:hypothetical protein